MLKQVRFKRFVFEIIWSYGIGIGCRYEPGLKLFAVEIPLITFVVYPNG